MSNNEDIDSSTKRSKQCNDAQEIVQQTTMIEDARYGGQKLPQQFFAKATEKGYFMWQKTLPGTNELSDVLWAHPESVKLLKAFPYALIMDATYKVNW